MYLIVFPVYPNNSNALLFLNESVTPLIIVPIIPPDLATVPKGLFDKSPAKVEAVSSIDEVNSLYFVWSLILLKAKSKFSKTKSDSIFDNLLPFKSELDKACNWFKVLILSSLETAFEFKNASKLAVWYCSVLIIPGLCVIVTCLVSGL